MENLVVNGEMHDKIFVVEKNNLLKYSVLPPKIWEILINKNLEFVNVPNRVYNLTNEENIKYNSSNSDIFKELFAIPIKSKILLPFLEEYKTFVDEDYTINCNTKNILNLLSYNLLLLKEMHKNGVFHNDIYPKNMMINKNLDIKFIDLDSLLIDDYISSENIYADDLENFSTIIKKNRRDDKLDLLYMYVKYLELGKFVYLTEIPRKLENLFLPKEIKNEILSYFKDYNKYPAADYYFEDIIEELLRIGYESPSLLNRKGLKLKK